MGKGIVTDYPEICFICGRPSEAEQYGRNPNENTRKPDGRENVKDYRTAGLGKGIRPAEGRRICANNRCRQKGRRSKADYSQGWQRDLPEEVRLFVFVGGNDENRNAKM